MDSNNEENVFSTFLDMMRSAMPDKIITNFVFVAEVVSNSNNELSIATSQGMTPWLAQGMLASAQEMILSGVETYDFDEDDDEDEDDE